MVQTIKTLSDEKMLMINGEMDVNLVVFNPFMKRTWSKDIKYQMYCKDGRRVGIQGAYNAFLSFMRSIGMEYTYESMLRPNVVQTTSVKDIMPLASYLLEPGRVRTVGRPSLVVRLFKMMGIDVDREPMIIEDMIKEFATGSLHNKYLTR